MPINQESEQKKATPAAGSGSRSLVRNTGIVSLLTLLSRFFGLIRDLLMARIFGASAIADCFFVAFRIPNLLRSFVAEGALSAAFVPVFASEVKNGKEKAQEVLSQVIGFLTLITSFLTVLGILFAPQILGLIAPGFMQKEHAPLCILLTQIMMPYIMCISLVAMLNGALNTANIFGVAALAQVVMNIVLIIGALIASNYEEITAVKILAYSVIAGGFIQVIIQIPALHRAGFKFRPKFNVLSRSILELTKLMLPAVLGATVYQISQFINTLFATLLSTGSVSWLFYADRITQLPIGIFSIALASVLLPALSKANADNNKSAFAGHFSDSLRYTSYFIIPMSGILIVFASEIVKLIFERGEFTADDTLNTSLAVVAYSIGLWSVSCHSMVARAFIARKDTITPTVIGIMSLILSVLFSLLLMGDINAGNSRLALFFKNIQSLIYAYTIPVNLAHAGLALSSSLASLFSFTALALIISGKKLDITWGGFIAATAKIFISSVAGLYLGSLIPDTFDIFILNTLLRLGISIILIFLFSSLLKTRETYEIINLVRKKLFKK